MNLAQSALPRALPANPAAAAGFTLVELLTVMTIVGILIVLGVPSFRYVTDSNRISSEVNSLLGDMQFARSEAIKEGQTVTVCSSANPTAVTPTCSGVPSWQSGWIVFSDPNGNGALDAGESVLRVQRTFSAADTFTASGAMSIISFNREGFALGLANTVTVTLHAVTPNHSSTRCLEVTVVGQLTSQKAGVGGCA